MYVGMLVCLHVSSNRSPRVGSHCKNRTGKEQEAEKIDNLILPRAISTYVVRLEE